MATPLYCILTLDLCFFYLFKPMYSMYYAMKNRVKGHKITFHHPRYSDASCSTTGHMTKSISWDWGCKKVRKGCVCLDESVFFCGVSEIPAGAAAAAAAVEYWAPTLFFSLSHCRRYLRANTERVQRRSRNFPERALLKQTSGSVFFCLILLPVFGRRRSQCRHFVGQLL